MKLPSSSRMRPISTMSKPVSCLKTIRRAALLTVCIVALQPNASLYGQAIQPPRVSQLPPTAPTQAQQVSPAVTCQQPPCAATSAPGAPQPTRPHRASVSFANGLLTVDSNDSSLHQILRSISSRTGMTITGGVEEQRVFGTYGPSDPATILATLLGGTGVNMLLKDGPDHRPVELILTQRSGGPTASPITPQDEQIGAEDLSVQPPAASVPARQPVVSPAPVAVTAPSQPAPQTAVQPAQQVGAAPTISGPSSMPQPANNVLGNPNNTTPTASQIPTVTSGPIDALPTPSTTVQTQQGIVDTPNQTQQGPQAPTPDSIFQQLLQMQKAKAAAAAAPNSSTTKPAPTTTPPQ